MRVVVRILGFLVLFAQCLVFFAACIAVYALRWPASPGVLGVLLFVACGAGAWFCFWAADLEPGEEQRSRF